MLEPGDVFFEHQPFPSSARLQGVQPGGGAKRHPWKRNTRIHRTSLIQPTGFLN